MVDTGPLVAAANRRDRAHELAAAIVIAAGRDLVIPSMVLAETDYLLRSRVGLESAWLFLRAVASGQHSVAYMTAELVRRAIGIDLRYADLDLGLTDASVMAVAEREQAPVFTFDFEDFRAAPSDKGPWALVVDESRYIDSTS